MDVELHWNKTSRREWDRLADRAYAGLQQRWAYGAAVEVLGGTVSRVSFALDGRPVAIAQVLMRRFGALITRGPVWVEDVEAGLRAKAIRMLRQGLRTQGARVSAVTPANETEAHFGMRWLTPATLAYLPVDPPDRAVLHGKWRNRLCAAQKGGLNVARLPNRFDPVQWLVEADKAQQKARGYRALPESFTAAWLSVDKSQVLTLAADQGDGPVAAMMFLRHGSTATYHIGWSNAQGRAAHAHNLLLWRAAERLSAKGVKTLDLGTLDTVNTPGLARFKLGTGAMPHRLGGTWVTL